MPNAIQEAQRIGLTALKAKGAVSISLVGTASSFEALITPVDAQENEEDFTPSDDEEAYVYIDKAEITASGENIKNGKTFEKSEDGTFYEVTESKKKGPGLTARFRCRIYQDAV